MKYLFVILIILFSCAQNTAIDNSKSRIERVKDLSYRNMFVSDDLIEQLLEDGIIIWEMVSPIDEEVYIIKGKEDDKFELYKIDENLEKLRNIFYELWRKKDFEFTALIYQSSSVNYETQEERAFFVIEIEHEKLTGTFYIFVDSEKEWSSENIKFNYVDRN